MGYREDGFFNINWSQDSRNASTTGGGKQNGPFIFPDKSIRFLDAQASLQKMFNRGKDTLQNGDYKIHRGYIRNLEQPQFGNVPISRCNFQFNPQEIRQNVAMREDMYNTMLQDPNQLTQPIGAAVNFTFDLLFDRSHELSKGTSASSGVDGVTITGSQGGAADPMNINSKIDPYDIGVLADLRVLYSVIGQGFSKEMLEFQKKTFVENAKTYNKLRSGSQSEDGADSESGSETSTEPAPEDSIGNVDDFELSKILEANYGNWGLLMPNPVRVMFSSVFMLDGFITGTNVDFLKFNTKMVPLMCRVTMNMSAMYIGFARQDTFVTKTFKAAAEAQAAERAENEALKAELLKALNTTGSEFGLGTSWGESSDLKYWDKVIQSRKDPLPLWALVVNDQAAKNPNNQQYERNLYLGFPRVVPNKGGDDVNNPDGTRSRKGEDADDILKMYKQGSAFTIGYDWSIDVYGAITSGDALTQTTANVNIVNKTYTTNPNIRKIGSYSGSESASSEEQWGSGSSGNGVKAERIRRRTIKGNGPDALSNKADQNIVIHRFNNPTSINSTFSWLKTAYYVVEINITLRVSYGTGGELATSYKSIFSASGTSNVNQKFNIDWLAGQTTITNGVSDQAPKISNAR